MIKLPDHQATDRHHAGPDAVSWLHPRPDGSQTLYVIRPGRPTLIVDGLHLRAGSGVPTSIRPQDSETTSP